MNELKIVFVDNQYWIYTHAGTLELLGSPTQIPCSSLSGIVASQVFNYVDNYVLIYPHACIRYVDEDFLESSLLNGLRITGHKAGGDKIHYFVTDEGKVWTASQGTKNNFLRMSQLQHLDDFNECKIKKTVGTDSVILFLSHSGKLFSKHKNTAVYEFTLDPNNKELKVQDAQAFGNAIVCLTTNGDVYVWGNNHFSHLGLVAKEIAEPCKLNIVNVDQIHLHHNFLMLRKGSELYLGGSLQHYRCGNNKLERIDFSFVNSLCYIKGFGSLVFALNTHGQVYFLGQGAETLLASFPTEKIFKLDPEYGKNKIIISELKKDYWLFLTNKNSLSASFKLFSQKYSDTAIITATARDDYRMQLN